MGLARSIINALEFHQAYRNPIEIAYRRRFDPRGQVRVVHRATGVEVYCKVASQRMFGETWRDRDYDVPKIPIRPDDVVLDIGGNHGFFTCYAAHRGAQVFTFEPEPSLFRSIQQNVACNGMGDRVKASCCGVSDRAGRTEMILTEEFGGGRNTIIPDFAKNTQMVVTNKIEVELTTLNAILEENHLDHIRICKIDCEGAELMILSAITPETARKVDAFVIEYHLEAYPVEDLLKLILSWGTHQVSYAEDKDYCTREIIRAVRLDLLTK